MLNSYKFFKLFSLSQKLGIKPVFFIFYFFVNVSSSKAQENLVPNGSFEDTIYCPMGTANFQSVAEWYSPTFASPDYYNSCAGNNGGGVPYNDWGFQYPQDGNAYAGLGWGWKLNADNYREYIAIKLIEPLKAKETYCFNAYISLLDSVSFASNNFGFILTSNPVVDYSTEELIPSASLNYNMNSIILDNFNWTLIETTFVAHGGEEYMTIGNFRDNGSTNFVEISQNAIGGQTAYYYIDNVSLGKCKSSVNFPNVFTPNNDGTNDLYRPSIQGVLNAEWTIYNRWGNEIFRSNFLLQGWDGTYQNNECSEGVYFYVCEYSDAESQLKTKTGFIHLIR